MARSPPGTARKPPPPKSERTRSGNQSRKWRDVPSRQYVQCYVRCREGVLLSLPTWFEDQRFTNRLLEGRLVAAAACLLHSPAKAGAVDLDVCFGPRLLETRFDRGGFLLLC